MDDMIPWAPTIDPVASAVWVRPGMRVSVPDFQQSLVQRMEPLLAAGGRDAQALVLAFLPRACAPVTATQLIELLVEAGMIRTAMLPMVPDGPDWHARQVLTSEAKAPLESLKRFLRHLAIRR